ncbi:hypothetical protein ACWEQ7_04245 [Streptomyces sp. NPDC004069]
MPEDRRPVTSTRVIPAGARLPERPPEPGEAPPWRTPPATDQPEPKERPRDWLDDILDSGTAPEPVPEKPGKERRAPAETEEEGAEPGAGTEVQRKPSPRLPDWWRAKPEHLLEQPTEQAENTTANTAPTSPDSAPTHADPAAVEAPPDTTQQQPATRKEAQRRIPQQSLLDAWDGIRPRTRWLLFHAAAATAGWPIGLVDWATDTAAWYAAGHWTSPSAWVLYGLGACTITLYRHARGWAWPVAWAAAIPVSSVVAGVLLYGTGYHP